MRVDAAVVAAQLCVALAAHFVPLTVSPLPLSVDGFALRRIAGDMASQGRWQIDPASLNSYNMKLPGYSLLWSAVVQVAGLSPLVHAQIVLPLFTTAAVLPAYLLAVKATGRRIAGAAAGLFVALFGSFLLLTSSVAKESIGLLVFPVAVLLFQERADPRKRALAVVLLAFLPFLHSLTTFLTFGMVAALMVLTQTRALARGRFSWRAFALDAITGPGLAVAAWAYYASVDLPFLFDILAPQAVTLFLAVVVLLTALIIPRAKPARRPVGARLVSPASKILLVPALGFALLIGNWTTPLFAGTMRTQPALFSVLPALFVLAIFAIVGLQIVRRTTNRANDLVVSMLVAPVALTLFGLLRGLDPVGLLFVYRAFDFLDYALAILIGVAFAALWNAVPSRSARGALLAALLGTLLTTTPMAWNTPAVFGVENVTSSAEFQALAVVASLGARNVTTDQRLAGIGAMWFGMATDSSLPLKLRDNESVAGFDYAVVLERWIGVGAQVHPAPNVVVDPDALARFLSANRVVYVTGAAMDRIFVVKLV